MTQDRVILSVAKDLEKDNSDHKSERSIEAIIVLEEMMYKDIARLVLYRDLNRDSILTKVGDIIEDFELEREEKPALVSRCYTEIKRILDISTSFGFDRNLWQDYLTYVLVTHENSFTLTCEKVGAGDGTVNGFAKQD